MRIKLLLLVSFICVLPKVGVAQDITMYQQFNGRFDFTFIGNTLNTLENTNQSAPDILASSSASLNLGPNDVVEKAFLYWAGCGMGDFNVTLNGQQHTAERTFSYQRIQLGQTYNFFSAFKDITSQVQSLGNTSYTLSNLNVSSFLSYHFQNRTNFAGWAIIIIYKNDTLPLNQLNVYDGMQAVPDEIEITLNSLNVIDNQDAKIGFLAWEGDEGISVNEKLTINESVLSNLPLNPADNAFNGTNSFTDSNQLYNMDLDVYSIENNIQIGDTTATIKLSSGQDVVMVNAVVTKLNSQLPDATVEINKIDLTCDSRLIVVDYTVSNTNSTAPLPPGVPIAFYANGILVQYGETVASLAIGESVSIQTSFILPAGIPDNFELSVVVDDVGTGSGIVTEILENNNIALNNVTLLKVPEINLIADVVSCNEGFGVATFTFPDDLLVTDSNNEVSFYTSQEDADNRINAITNTSAFVSDTTPRRIFVRVANANCYATSSFLLLTRNCPPTIYNYISANDDGVNDTFFIDGLRNIFLNFNLEVYNRWGVLLWRGNNATEDWKGVSEKGFRPAGDDSPDGTYFYILQLNDPDYPEPYNGFLYLNR